MAVKRIDHIAIVVPDLGEATSFYRDVLGLRLDRVERVDEQEVTIAFLPAGDSEVELLEPTTSSSGVARFLEKRGPGMHHLCLEVDDIEQALAELKAHGVELIDEQPVEGGDGKKMAFIHPRSAHGVLVELYELPARPRLHVYQPSAAEALRQRLALECRALRAGAEAFLQELRTPAVAPPNGNGNGHANGNGHGIMLKAAGQMLDEDEPAAE